MKFVTAQCIPFGYHIHYKTFTVYYMVVYKRDINTDSKLHLFEALEYAGCTGNSNHSHLTQTLQNQANVVDMYTKIPSCIIHPFYETFYISEKNH